MLGLFAGMLVAAAAGEDPQTVQASSHPILQEGVLDGCELLFQAPFKDHVYRNGGAAIATGAVIMLGFTNPQRDPIVAIKLLVTDLSGTAPDWERRNARPYSVWLMTDAMHTNRESLLKADTADNGGIISAFRFDKDFVAAFDSLIKTDKLTLTFNRKQGGADVEVPVTFPVDKLGRSAAYAFGECTLTGGREWQKRRAP